jgi:RNA polymerase-associated protein CTR9
MSDMSRSPTPPPPARPYDIALGPAEVITVDLDNLDNNPEDLIDLLKDGKPKVGVWTKLAGEYWRKGLLSAAEDIARAGVESACHLYFHWVIYTYGSFNAAFQTQNDVASLPPIYALLANLQIARARNAPKIILSNARACNVDYTYIEAKIVLRARRYVQ